MSFTNELKSIQNEDRRYIYRCNPERALETRKQRQERFDTAQRKVDQENLRLSEKQKSSPYVAKRRIQKYLKKLCIFEWVDVYIVKRHLILKINEEQLKEKSSFDGCYVWTTDLSEEQLNNRELYERYKDLKYIEDDFRTFKTTFLKIRPVYVRTLASTRGHIFHMMLAHMILRELRLAWNHFNITVEEGLKTLSLICYQTLQISEGVNVRCIPKQTGEAAALLDALKIELPKIDRKL